MRYAIQVNGAPRISGAAAHAQEFIKAAVGKGHEVILVFFYYDGVLQGFKTSAERVSGLDRAGGWTSLAKRHGLPLVLCVSAAERRGCAGPDGVLAGFRIGGLGEWVTACASADRCVVFPA